MSINFLGLPQNAFDRVCELVSEVSLLQMRKLSKDAQKMVDFSITKRKSTIYQMEISKNQNEIEIWMRFENNADYSTWAMSVMVVQKSLRNCAYSNPVNREISISIKSAQYQDVLESLKSLFERALIEYICFGDLFLWRISADFFQGFSISSISLESSRPNKKTFYRWLCLTKKLRPSNISCEIMDFSDECIAFLLGAADIAEEIVILMYHRVFTLREVRLVSIIGDIFGRKCKKLILGHKSPIISQDDVENLAQYFHHLDKIVELQGNTQGGRGSAQIGRYTVNCFNRGSELLIKQL